MRCSCMKDVTLGLWGQRFIALIIKQVSTVVRRARCALLLIC